MKYFLVIAFLTFMSIAGISEAENISSTESWASWEKVFASKGKKWKLLKDKKGIKVWARRVEMSPIRSFKGVKEYESNVNAMTAWGSLEKSRATPREIWM